MTSKRPYTGLHLPGGSLQSLRQPTQQELQAMLAQQLQVLAREIYCRAASDLLNDEMGNMTPEGFRALADASRLAAKSYFEAMGVQFQPETPDAETTP